jgi:hypothetical protein
MTDAIVQIAKQAPHTRTKQEWYAEIEKRAEAFRQRGESYEVAFTKFLNDPVGRVLFAAHQAAPGPISAGQIGSREPVRKNGDGAAGGDAPSGDQGGDSEVDTGARALRAASPAKFPTHAQAVAAFLNTPAGQKSYQNDKRANLKKAAAAMHGV